MSILEFPSTVASEPMFAGAALAGSGWRRVGGIAQGPLGTLVIGAVVGLIVWWLQTSYTNRRQEQRLLEEQQRSELRQQEERQRSELRVEEERIRSERERNAQLGLEIMRVAFGFYTRLVEVARIEDYSNQLRLGSLPSHYEEFRIKARVLEEQLRVYFPDGKARWLWHGTVDMLSVRYYGLAHPGARLKGMIKTHSQHPNDSKIPSAIRPLFLGPTEFHADVRSEFHNAVMNKFEHMLIATINLVVHGEIDPAGVDPVVLEPGRGSQLRQR